MRKTKYMYLTLLQADYGQGWEDLGEAKTSDQKEIKELKRFFNETRLADRNHNVRYRFIERRVIND